MPKQFHNDGTKEKFTLDKTINSKYPKLSGLAWERTKTTDYRHTKAKYKILCCPNSNPLHVKA